MSAGSLLRRNVANNAAVQALIEDRFYEGELATVNRPEYPCANFAFQGGAPDIDIADLGDQIVKIWTWSKTSYEQTRDIYEAIRTVIDNQNFSDSECRVIFKRTAEPLDYHEPIDAIYATVATFRARVIKRT